MTLAQILRRVSVTAAICSALCACYPALKAVQPGVTLSVTDTSGAPVEGAAFTLATFKQPFATPNNVVRATYRTDEDGHLTLPKKRKWEWQVALPDGITWYTWAYCVERQGYKAAAVSEPEFGAPIAIVLENATTPSECIWPADADRNSRVRTSDDE